MKVLTKTTASDDLLNDAQFDPVFDQDGNLVDIVHLKVTTDRSRGIKAMLELANSSEPGDEIVDQNGWTGKQKRILNSPAPGPAHTIKRSKRWDAALGQFVPTATLMLPSEVVWVLFEEAFANNYSVEVKEIIHESEDIVSSGVDSGKDLPGRIFYARACVTLTLHLANGKKRKFEGIGVAYDTVRMEMTGNVYAVNSARRTAEKGAVSDAKREALANMGRVFRRAFEDGAEALRVIEEKLMEKIRIANAPKTAESKKETVAAPKTAKQAEAKEKEKDTPQEKNVEVIPGDYVPAEAFEEMEAKQAAKSEKEDPAPKAKEADTDKQATADEDAQEKDAEPAYVLIVKNEQVAIPTPQDTFDVAIATLNDLDEEEAKTFLEMNQAVLLKAENDDEIGGITFADLMDMSPEAAEEEVEEATQGPILKPAKNTGEAILKAYEKALKDATDKKEVEAILDANTELAKSLTKRQKSKLAQMVVAAS